MFIYFRKEMTQGGVILLCNRGTFTTLLYIYFSILSSLI